MSDTSGFYKNDEGGLLFGPNGVTGPTYDLQRASRDEPVYPVDNWYWFDSEEEAQAFFGLPEASASQ
jgi:hypothetical protein